MDDLREVWAKEFNLSETEKNGRVFYLLTEDNPKFPETGKLIQAAKELGIRVESKYWNPYPCEMFNRSFIYGTREFCLKHQQYSHDIFSKQEYIYDFSFLLAIFDGFKLFNWDAQLLPAGQAIRKIILSPDKFTFCRPNDGNKSFAGHEIDKLSVLNGSSPLHSINPWDFVVISSLKQTPKEEYRFFCLRKNDKVEMLWTRYLPDDSPDVPQAVIDYAKEKAEYIFDRLTVGESFVLDIGYTKGEYVNEKPHLSIIELNSWNSSAFYSIDPKQILQLLVN